MDTSSHIKKRYAELKLYHLDRDNSIKSLGDLQEKYARYKQISWSKAELLHSLRKEIQYLFYHKRTISWEELQGNIFRYGKELSYRDYLSVEMELLNWMSPHLPVTSLDTFFYLADRLELNDMEIKEL